MISILKALLTQYVRDPSSVEIWIDQGKVKQEWPSLYLHELVVINISEMTQPYQSILGAIRVWYEENHGGLSDKELQGGMSFDVEVLKEDDAFMQVRLNIRSRYIMKREGEMIDAVQCS